MGAKHMVKTKLNDQDENSNLREDNIIHDTRENLGNQLQRNFRTNVLFGTLGFVFISSGIALLMSFNTLFEHIVKKNMVITPDSYILEYWKTPPIPIYAKFYLFNITNHEDYPWTTVKPRLQEVGPYVYQEHRDKVDLQWHENNTVSYRQLVSFTFESHLSIGSEDDVIFTINSPLVLATDYVKSSNFMLKFMFKTAMKVIVPTFVMKRTVGQLMSGFNDPFIKSAQILGISTLSKFGYLLDKNGTNFEYTVNTGVGNSEKFATVENWEGKSSMSFWPDQYCNKISGTDGSNFPTYVSKYDTPQIFTPEACRTFDFKYFGPSEIFGVLAYQFKLADDTFSNANGTFQRVCSCAGKLCHTSGVYNMSACTAGIPMFASFPHFYKADPWLLDQFDGLHPNQHDHESFIHIEPITGVPVNASAKVQLNMHVAKFESLENMIFPLLWGDRMAMIDEPLADKFLWLTQRLYYFSRVLSACMLTIGMLFLTFGIAYRVFAQDGRQWLLISQNPRVLVTSN